MSSVCSDDVKVRVSLVEYSVVCGIYLREEDHVFVCVKGSFPIPDTMLIYVVFPNPEMPTFVGFEGFCMSNSGVISVFDDEVGAPSVYSGDDGFALMCG